jgi:hypothetical protein
MTNFCHNFRVADNPQIGLACAYKGLVDTDLQFSCWVKERRIANVPLLVVALPE